MRRTLPPTRDLACFEAVARHRSVTRAAAELNLTQSAVSRRLAALEELLGQNLFLRDKQRLTPTVAAEEYAEELRSLLNRVEVATTRLLSHGRKGGVLTVACLPTFGSRWLVPRLARFIAAHPTVDINLISKIRLFSFEEDKAHAAIHFGSPTWPGARIHHLMDEHVIPVCAPQLIGGEALVSPEGFARLPLLQHTTRPYLWRDWLADAGASGVNGIAGPKFEYYSLVIQAAIAGIGVAILPDFLVREEIQSGALMVAYPHRMRCEDAYFVVYPKRFDENVNVQAFVGWLRDEARLYIDSPEHGGPGSSDANIGKPPS